MGATGWDYFVPYQADVTAALQRLKYDIFAQGRYEYDEGFSQAALHSAQERLASFTPDPKKSLAQMQKYLARIQPKLAETKTPKPKPKPNTIQKLLKHQGEDGPHSILDIDTVSAKPAFRAVNPLSISLVREIFGTDQPTRTQIESKYREGALDKHISERWQGVYFVAYRDSSPDELFFVGCSGD